MKRYQALSAMSLLLACNSGWCRPIELWTAERLLRRADLVVIATVASSEDTENTDRFLEEDLVQRKTRLRVEAVLKGHDVAPMVTLIHFRSKTLKERNVPDGKLSGLVNGPSLIAFPEEETPQRVEEGDRSAEGLSRFGGDTRRYLLFLRRRDGDVYDPASGQTDAVFSVNELKHLGN